MSPSNSFSRSALAAYEALALPVWLFSAETLQILASNRAAQTVAGHLVCKKRGVAIQEYQ